MPDCKVDFACSFLCKSNSWNTWIARFVDTISSITNNKSHNNNSSTILPSFIACQSWSFHHHVVRLILALSFQVQNFSPSWKRMVAMIPWWVEGNDNRERLWRMARWLGLLKQFISILFAREFVDFTVGVDKFRWIFLFFCVCPDGCSTLFLTLNKMEMNNQTSWVVKSFLVDLDEGCRVCIRVFQQQLCCWSLILQFFLPQQRKPPTNHTIFREENRWKGCNIHPLHL